MATIFDTTLTDDVTHDESAGLQTSGVPDANTGEDNDDHDILLNSIGGLLTTLTGLGAPDTAIGAARNQVLTFVEGADPVLKFRLADGADSDGADPLLDSELSTLTTTAGDDPITLVRVSDTIIFGYANYGEADARVAFALYLEPIAPTASEPGGANITIVQYEAIHHPDADDPDDALDLSGLVFVDAVQDVAFDDFSTAAAGQNLWNSVTDPTSGIQLLFTGFELGSDTVNTSDFGIGSNNQSIVIGDGIVVDFVKGQSAPTQTSADDLANIDFNERVEGPSGGFTLVQTGGNAANRVGAEVFAYDSSELGSAYHDGIIGGASQTIVAIEVWSGNTLVSAWTRADGITNNTDPNVTFALNAINDDGVIIQGLLVNYRVEFQVGMIDGDDTGQLDRFSVQNVSAGGQANDTFDLGDIRLGGQEAAETEVGSHVRFEDDGPTQTVTAEAEAAAQLEVELDETTGDVDRYADGETADSYVNDDNGYLAQVTTAVAGGLVGLFTANGDYGSDLAGSLTSTVTFVGVPAEGLLTNLSATDGGAITLFADSAIQLSGKDTLGHTVFTIAIVGVSGGELQLQTTLLEALEHGDNTRFDEAVDLLIPDGTLELQYQVTRSDAEGDTVVAADTILLADDDESVFSFDDDGPTQTVTANADAAAQLEVELDETTGDVDRYADGETADSYVNDDNGYLAQVTTAVAGGLASLFSAAGDYGADGEGSLTETMTFVGVPAEGLLTSLSATDGGAITLFANSEGTLLTGTDEDGHSVFTIAIVDVGGGVLQLQTTLIEALEHGDNTLFDEAVDLLIPDGALELQYQVTRSDAEGDTIVAADSILLADDDESVFSFDDDGPLAITPESGSITNAAGETTSGLLDSSVTPPPFAFNFGSDGAGAYGGLVFTGLNDEELTDGAALKDADGNPLFSNKVAITLSGFGTNVLTARAGATTVFTITLGQNEDDDYVYTMEMFAKIDDGSLDFDNFATAGAGNFTWLGVAGDEFPDKDLLVTGGNVGLDQVNNDSDDLAIGNQWIDAAKFDSRGNFTPAELIRLDFVNLGIDANTGSRTLATIDDTLAPAPVTHYDVNNAGFTIMQTLAGRPVDVRISAIDETSDIGGTDIATDLTTSPEEIDQIVAVTIITNSLTDPDGETYLREDGNNTWVTWLENDVIVHNLEGATPNLPHLRDRVFVSTEDGFNRLEISNAETVNSMDAFAIGDVEVGAAGREIDLAFNSEIVDGDGDANSIGLIGITLNPESSVG